MRQGRREERRQRVEGREGGRRQEEKQWYREGVTKGSSCHGNPPWEEWEGAGQWE